MIYEPDIEQLKRRKLDQNSEMCNNIIENEFKSAVKGDINEQGSFMQPYRMNRDDQANLNGYMGLINSALITGTKPEEMPLFSWQNANQIECVNDWHYLQILGLIQDFGVWKTLVLKRQDAIKVQILNAETIDELEAVELDYGDLLTFGGDGA